MNPPGQESYFIKLPHPSRMMKWIYRFPILLYRLGLGRLTGRLFMIMITTGRKSGLPRCTAIEFHEFAGRKYVFSGWGTRSDWYRNIEADPNLTIMTWRGAESVHARRITSDSELSEAFSYAVSNPGIRMVMRAIGIDLDLNQFLKQKDRFVLVTFDPAEVFTPQPLNADFAWIWLALALLGVIMVILHSWR